MVAYAKYATTVIGAYSVPDWYEALDRLVAVGQPSRPS
jgi:5-methyltetrahydropteroyltriglutamate--homocysteine methyltransferase